MLNSILGLLSPGARRARLSILIFHRVLPAPDLLQPDIPDSSHFDSICRWLSKRFVVLPLDDAVRRLYDGTLPSRAAAITFDDGYADNHDVALPILQRHGLSATFFVATGYLDGGRMFNDSVAETIRQSPASTLDLRATPLGDLGTHDLSSAPARRTAIGRILERVKHHGVEQRRAFCAELQRVARVAHLPDDLMMTSSQVRAMHRAGMVVGSHTVRHPMLAHLDDAEALDELRAGRAALEALLDAPVTLFAYPNGRPGEDYSARTVALVRAAGFDAAVTTAWGAADRASDRYQLPRFTPWDRGALRFGARMAMNLRRGRERTAPPVDVAPLAAPVQGP